MLALALVGLPSWAGAEPCCDGMGEHGSSHCEAMSSGAGCECPHEPLAATRLPTPPSPAVTTTVAAAPVAPFAAVCGAARSAPSHLRLLLIRSVVLQL